VVGTYPNWGGTPAVFSLHGSDFGVSQQNDNTIGCWNATTGELLWQFTAAGELLTPPIVVNEVIYQTDRNANLYALNPKNGRTLWSDNLGDFGDTPMISAGQSTLIVANGSRIFAYRPQ
jgi:outer membrane protein assembly factor BamB